MKSLLADGAPLSAGQRQAKCPNKSRACLAYANSEFRKHKEALARLAPDGSAPRVPRAEYESFMKVHAARFRNQSEQDQATHHGTVLRHKLGLHVSNDDSIPALHLDTDTPCRSTWTQRGLTEGCLPTSYAAMNRASYDTYRLDYSINECGLPGIASASKELRYWCAHDIFVRDEGDIKAHASFTYSRT